MLFNIVIASLLGVCTLAAPLDAGPAETGNISGAVKAIEAGPLEPGVTSWGTSSIINELSGRESKSSGLESRQRFCQFKDEINGNGNPTYRVLHKQLSVSYSVAKGRIVDLQRYSKLLRAPKHLAVVSARQKQSLTP